MSGLNVLTVDQVSLDSLSLVSIEVAAEQAQSRTRRSSTTDVAVAAAVPPLQTRAALHNLCSKLKPLSPSFLINQTLRGTNRIPPSMSIAAIQVSKIRCVLDLESKS